MKEPLAPTDAVAVGVLVAEIVRGIAADCAGGRIERIEPASGAEGAAMLTSGQMIHVEGADADGNHAAPNSGSVSGD